MKTTNLISYPLGRDIGQVFGKIVPKVGEDKIRVHSSPENYETGGSIPVNTQPDSEYDPHPAIESAWLVSGNEGYEAKLAVLEEVVLLQFGLIT